MLLNLKNHFQHKYISALQLSFLRVESLVLPPTELSEIAQNYLLISPWYLTLYANVRTHLMGYIKHFANICNLIYSFNRVISQLISANKCSSFIDKYLFWGLAEIL